YIEKHLMGSNGDGKLNNPYWATWVFASSDDEATYELVKRYTRRPAETLYHTAEDPFEMKNLINQDNLSDIQGRLASELDVWMKTQGDPGSAQDSLQALNASRRGEHRYIPPSK
ncbi:MAG TPA: heparan N-sulfatase, partial [Verrucomicrobiales bacterium]|nr:heparan N-sulfatase [Verrucomicrobiales bacterium]